MPEGKNTFLTYYLGALGVSVVYLLLRFIYPQTIEFGYDQPRLALTVMDYVQNGTFLTSQNYSLASPWGNLSWGPALVLLCSFFLRLTQDPITLSLAMATFNLISILLVYHIGYKFFSPAVGIIAALIFAVHPWWIVFSRMFYQPTPVPTFIAFSMLFLFQTLKKPKSLWLAPLLLTWAILLQTYIITISFIFSSLILLIIYTKLKLNFKALILAGFTVLVLYIPSIKYYLENPQIFKKFVEFNGKYTTTFRDTIEGFALTISGGNFKWQLGYAYDKFTSNFPYFTILNSLVILIVFILFLTGLVYLLKTKNKFVVCLYTFIIAPLWAIPLIDVERVVPRYFLYILPSVCLMLGIAINYLVKCFGKKVLILPIYITVFWLVFIFKYFNFVNNFDYPHGYLSNWSDIPYTFLNDSFKWLENDSQQKGYNSYTVSLDPKILYKLNLNDAQKYYWRYVAKKNELLYGKVGHYLMYFAPPVDASITSYTQFGPYIIYDVSP